MRPCGDFSNSSKKWSELHEDVEGAQKAKAPQLRERGVKTWKRKVGREEPLSVIIQKTTQCVRVMELFCLFV